MMAWVYVFDHSYFAMTDAAGAYEIRGLAPGTYRLSIRHGPGGLARDVEVRVTSGGTTRADVAFETADLKLPVR
jgi:hypothetical protein